MESIGEKLKAARESNGYSFDQVARDTHIAKRFLMALEEEDFSAFPGEPYILGFLKNYAEFVGLDPHEILSLYKNIKLQEQPVPMEELLDTGRSFPLKTAGIAAAALVVLIAGYFTWTGYIAPRMSDWQKPAAKTQPRSTVSKKTSNEYPLPDDKPLERSFSSGDTVVVTSGDTVYKLALGLDASSLVVTSPGGPVKLVKQEERAVDLDNDGSADVKVLFVDFNEKEPANSLQLRFERLAAGAVAAAPVAPTADAAVIGSCNVASRRQETVTIMQAQTPAPFIVNVDFQGPSLFRYYSDGSTREEKYFKAKDTFNLSVRNEIRIWTSNAGTLVMKVAGNNVQLGAVGEVATKSVRWVKDEGTGGYKLVLAPVY